MVRRCIHPSDDLEKRDLKNAEARWSYLVFLQILGKYLDLKAELGEANFEAFYARESFRHYVNWMVENERPFVEVLDQVEYPTETWPAHDVRKSCIFDYASIYGDPDKVEIYRERAEYFFNESFRDTAI